jgi:hypothetical protein
MKLEAHQQERGPAQAARPERRGGARTVLAGKGALRRFAPLPAARRSGAGKAATGGSGGNTHGLVARFIIAELDAHNPLTDVAGLDGVRRYPR